MKTLLATPTRIEVDNESRIGKAEMKVSIHFNFIFDSLVILFDFSSTISCVDWLLLPTSPLTSLLISQAKHSIPYLPGKDYGSQIEYS